MFPCITKETHHAPALQRDPGSESGAQKTMLSHLGAPKLGVGWLVGEQPISVFATPKKNQIASKWPKEPLHFPDQPFWTTSRLSGKLIILCFVSFKEFGSPKKLVGFYFRLSWKWAASFLNLRVYYSVAELVGILQQQRYRKSEIFPSRNIKDTPTAKIPKIWNIKDTLARALLFLPSI